MNNGQGDKAVETSNRQLQGSAWVINKNAESTGAWLKQIQTNGQSVVRLQLNNLASSLSFAGIGGGAVSVSVAAQPDTRSVKLSRGGAPAAKQRGQAGFDEEKGEWEELVDGNWVRYGHSLFSYDEEYLRPTAGGLSVIEKRPVTRWQNFSSSRSGTWSTNLNWWWSPVGGTVLNPTDGDTINASTQWMPKGTPYKDLGSEWQGGSSSPLTRSQVFTLKDVNDGATAKARYDLKLHDEWDEPTSLGQTVRNGQKLFPTMRIVGPQQDKSWDIGTTTSFNASVGFNFMSGFKVGDWLNIGGVFDASGKVELTGNYSATAPKLTLLTTEESALPCINYLIKRNKKLVRHWDEAGHVANPNRTDGKWLQEADEPVNIQDCSPNWFLLPSNQPA